LVTSGFGLDAARQLEQGDTDIKELEEWNIFI
jgi:hypothetical protein